MGSRRKARELAVQVLFCLEFLEGDVPAVFDLVCENFSSRKAPWAFARDLVLGTCKKVTVIDEMIRRSSRNWRLERMSRLDRSILRLAVYELIYKEDIPPKVSIDEAVDLGKRFGNVESGKFINGILDDIYSSMRGKITTQ
ncbi:MAG TPA: transcription antitermination factor NusB [Desulfobacteraceae bacterium]|nr:MAG: transcription antitermination factor NusB [Desulfobacteraceae bacterium 4484_190.3]HDZ24489.1 transcription antitermination factor NusB [Desulfobacteraceae bacterium]